MGLRYGWRGSRDVNGDWADLVRWQTVCVRPQWVHKCAVDLRGSNVKVACVVGFHEGTYDLLHKAQ